MIQIPKDLLEKNPYIKLRLSDMYGIIVNGNTSFINNDVLQMYHCLELVLEGSIKVSYAGECDTLSKGDIQFRKRGNYQLFPLDDYSSLLIFMENEFVSFFLDQHVSVFNTDKFTSDLPPFRFVTSPFINFNGDEIMRKIQNPGSYSNCIVKYSTHQILLQLLSEDKSKRFVSYLRHLIADRKIDLVYFMESNFTQNLTLERISKLTGRSLSSFKREFKAKFNTTPIKWQLNRRLIYADYLIHNSDQPISDIAFSTGFENLSHFSKTYKQKFGITPSQAKLSVLQGVAV